MGNTRQRKAQLLEIMENTETNTATTILLPTNTTKKEMGQSTLESTAWAAISLSTQPPIPTTTHDSTT